MSAKITELYNRVLNNDPSVSSLKVAVFHKFNGNVKMFTGFLQEDINFGVSTTYSDQMPNIPILSGLIEGVKNAGNSAAGVVDGSLNLTNPLATRMLFQGSSTSGFKVNITKFCLDGSEDLLKEANDAVKLNMPVLGSDNGSSFFIKAPGGYNFPIDKAGNSVTSHGNNTWSLWMGGKFAINHLVCNDFSVTVSKETVKTKSGSLQPMYITLNFDFSPDRMLFLSDVQGGPFNSMSSVSSALNGNSNGGGITLGEALERGTEIAKGVITGTAGYVWDSAKEVVNRTFGGDTPTQKTANNVMQNHPGPGGS